MKNKTLFVTCTAILILTLKINASDRTLTEIQRIHIKANSNSIAEDEKKRKAFFEEEVNLDKKEFSDFLTNEFKQTPISPAVLLFRILQYDPMKGMKWLNNSYDNIYQTVEGKHNFVVSIWKLKFVESNQIMALLLDDKTVIPHMGEHSPLKAMDDRVCDLVYTELIGSIYEASGEKETLFSPQNSIDIDTKLEARDKAISNLKEWWKDHSEEFLKTQPSLVEKYPELKDTIEELKNKIKRQIEKQKSK